MRTQLLVLILFNLYFAYGGLVRNKRQLVIKKADAGGTGKDLKSEVEGISTISKNGKAEVKVDATSSSLGANTDVDTLAEAEMVDVEGKTEKLISIGNTKSVGETTGSEGFASVVGKLNNLRQALARQAGQAMAVGDTKVDTNMDVTRQATDGKSMNTKGRTESIAKGDKESGSVGESVVTIENDKMNGVANGRSGSIGGKSGEAQSTAVLDIQEMSGQKHNVFGQGSVVGSQATDTDASKVGSDSEASAQSVNGQQNAMGRGTGAVKNEKSGIGAMVMNAYANAAGKVGAGQSIVQSNGAGGNAELTTNGTVISDTDALVGQTASGGTVKGTNHDLNIVSGLDAADDVISKVLRGISNLKAKGNKDTDLVSTVVEQYTHKDKGTVEIVGEGAAEAENDRAELETTGYSVINDTQGTQREASSTTASESVGDNAYNEAQFWMSNSDSTGLIVGGAGDSATAGGAAKSNVRSLAQFVVANKNTNLAKLLEAAGKVTAEGQDTSTHSAQRTDTGEGGEDFVISYNKGTSTGAGKTRVSLVATSKREKGTVQRKKRSVQEGSLQRVCFGKMCFVPVFDGEKYELLSVQDVLDALGFRAAVLSSQGVPLENALLKKALLYTLNKDVQE